MKDNCACGRPTRYSTSCGLGSCNKRGRCKTWDELYETNSDQTSTITELQGRIAELERTVGKLFTDGNVDVLSAMTSDFFPVTKTKLTQLAEAGAKIVSIRFTTTNKSVGSIDMFGRVVWGELTEEDKS